MDLTYIIETLEPKRDQLFNEMEQLFNEAEEKENKIKQIDFILDNFVYKKEPSN